MQEYTGLTDSQNNPIMLRSVVNGVCGAVYIVLHDRELGYVIYDIYTKTIEKLTSFICYRLTITPNGGNLSL